MLIKKGLGNTLRTSIMQICNFAYDFVYEFDSAKNSPEPRPIPACVCGGNGTREEFTCHCKQSKLAFNLYLLSG